MNKKCACGTIIGSNRSLCKECGEIYGYKQKEWPAWLQWQVADIQREWDWERNHDELCIFNDEFFYANKKRKVKPALEIDFEEMLWRNQ